MNTIQIRNKLYKELENHLENMCAYLATGNKDLFRYYAGKADGIKEILEEVYNFDESHASEHIKAMWDIMEENW